mgnify:CR=1 FL=1
MRELFVRCVLSLVLGRKFEIHGLDPMIEGRFICEGVGDRTYNHLSVGWPGFLSVICVEDVLLWI